MAPEITSVDTHVVETPRKPLLFVEVHTDDGVVGLGEADRNASARTMRAAIDDVSEHVVGMNPFSTERLFERLYNVSVVTPPGVPAGEHDLTHTAAASAIDIACWDIKAKCAGVPLYELLGGPVGGPVRAYANGWWQDLYRAGDDDPAAFAERASAVVSDGYSAVKFNPFGWGPGWLGAHAVDEAVERVGTVRDAVGNAVDVLIEGHKQLTPSAAITVASRLERYEPAFFEEPTPPKAAELAQVVAGTTIPVATGESLLTHHAFADILEDGVGVVQPDLLRTGGVTMGRKIAAMADAAGVSVAPHNACGPVGTAVSAHLCASIPNAAYLEVFDDYAHPAWMGDLFDGGVTVADGVASISETPGIGVSLNRTELDYRRS